MWSLPWLLTGALALLFGLCTTSNAGDANPVRDNGLIAAVQSLYGLDEEQAIERLAQEDQAWEVYLRVRSLGLPEFAGAWFDGESQQLHVAMSDEGHRELVEAMGAIYVPARYSLDELLRARSDVIQISLSSDGRVGPIKESYIDYRRNKVVLAVPEAARAEIKEALDPNQFRLIEPAIEFTASAGAVVGANGFRNATIASQCALVSEYPCSIGVSVEGGFITAGHCGEVGNEIRTPNDVLLGSVAGSTWSLSSGCSSVSHSHGEDSGWVQTEAGWTGTAQVNGYDAGILTIDAAYSGLLEAPVGATVCRYGQTTASERCGQIEQKNFNLPPSSGLENFTRASGSICTLDGDSGGPFLTPSGQVQGINYGGIDTSECANGQSATAVLFQPVTTTINRFGLTMLTAHGDNVPAISGMICNALGYSIIACWAGYESQGATSLQWKHNGATVGNGASQVIGCVAGQNALLEAVATNPYGTGDQSMSIHCNGGPPQ